MIIGHHLGINGSLKQTFRYFRKALLDSNNRIAQIFLTSPHAFNPPRIDQNDIKSSARYIQKHQIHVVVHGSFLINLCRNPDERPHRDGVELLVRDLNESVQLGAIGVVIHMGKNVCKVPTEEAVENYVKGVRSALQRSHQDSVIILETGAGQGTEVCTKLEDLSRLRKMFTEEEKKRIRICLDTCHMFAAGYDMGDPDYVDFLCVWIDRLFGWENIAVVHLNDSKQCLNSRRDNHADIGKGFVDTDGLIRFVEHLNLNRIPIVLETPCDDQYMFSDQIKFIENQLFTKLNH